MRVNVHLVPCSKLQAALRLLNNRIAQEAGLDGVRFETHMPHITVLMFNMDSSDENKHRVQECALQASDCCPIQLTGLRIHVSGRFFMFKVDCSESLQRVCKTVWESCAQILPACDAWQDEGLELDWYEPHITVAVADTDAQLRSADAELVASYMGVFCSECPADVLVCDRVEVSVAGTHGAVLGILP